MCFLVNLLHSYLTIGSLSSCEIAGSLQGGSEVGIGQRVDWQQDWPHFGEEAAWGGGAWGPVEVPFRAVGIQFLQLCAVKLWALLCGRVPPSSSQGDCRARSSCSCHSHGGTAAAATATTPACRAPRRSSGTTSTPLGGNRVAEKGK